jgi:hypothetical protein
MPETPYVEGIDIKLEATGEIVSSVDIADTEAREQLEELSDYVNSIFAVELISADDWEALTTEQKQAKGLVAIQNSSTGYIRGDLVNGADYSPIPSLVYSSTRNAGSTGTLSYTFEAYGKYQIIAVALPGDGGAWSENSMFLTHNGLEITDNVYFSSPSYDSSTGTGNLKGLVFKYTEITANNGDTIAFNNGATNRNGGMNLLVLKNADVSSIRLDQSRINNDQSFMINNNSVDYYVEVSKTGYYSGQGSTFGYITLSNVQKNSEPCPSSIYYGISYVILITNRYGN